MATIAVIAAGAMGSGVGRRLVQNGCTVLTILDGRSESTRKRATDAGMKDASFEEIVQKASWVLSILPPSEALGLASKFLTYTASRSTDEHPLSFVDCNAVSPGSLKHIASLFATSSVSFVDAGIIGGPPSNGYDPTFYASADDPELLARFAGLKEFGLKISPLTNGAGLGDASALKMSYAGITKGITGLFTTMILAANASSPATAEALRHELNASQPELLRRITKVVPPMLPKAYRWVGEMEEIAEFVGQGEGDIYKGVAKLYQRIEKSSANEGEDIKVLKQFVEEAREM